MVDDNKPAIIRPSLAPDPANPALQGNALGRYVATGQHRSEYPSPITFKKGAPLAVGNKYEGPEGWSDWYFCTTPGQQGGWVPGQLIGRFADARNGVALEDYTAKELDVDEGDVLAVSKILDGWMWCERLSDDQSGWVPMELLRKSGDPC